MSKRDWVYVLIFTIIWTIAMYLIVTDAKAIEPRRPIPVEQFDSRTHVWTARAMVAESGWESANDQIAVAYVFSRRWKAMRRRWPDLRFLDVVFRYAKGLGAQRREYSKRQIWTRALSPDMGLPTGWPMKLASWKRHKPLWAKTLDRAALWSRGRLLDPCRGKAEYFGGEMDEPRPGMVPVECVDVRNLFYKVQ